MRTKAVRAKSKSRGLHFFFYINSIFVLVVVGFSALIKVTLDLYQMELLAANRLNSTNEILRLPLTGSPDSQFALMVLIVAFAIVAALGFMLKLDRLNFLKPGEKNKKVKKK